LSEYVGIDPQGLVGLADTTDQYCTRIGLARRNLDSDCGGLSGVAGKLESLSADLRWRAAVIDEGQRACLVGTAPLTSPLWLVEFASTQVFDPTSRYESFANWRDRVFLLRLRNAEPGAAATALGAIGRSDALVLAREYPDLIGDLDGAPPQLRYAANEILIALEVTRLTMTLPLLESSLTGASPTQAIVARTEERIGEYQRWLDEGRQILLFDPTGDGRAVEVFGDLDAAEHIAVVVPGMANDIRNFDRLREDAQDLFGAAAGDTAAIAWLGYDTPDGVDAVSRAAADRAAPRLAAFLEGIDPGSQRSITVVAHSYGSVVAGAAAAGGIEADNLVFVGSPGTSLRNADEAILRSGGRVWSALAQGDPIGVGINPLASYRWWHGLVPMMAPVSTVCSLLSRDELWHGANPAGDDFGARRISTDGSFGHGQYFEATTLENLALILEGRYSEIRLVD